MGCEAASDLEENLSIIPISFTSLSGVSQSHVSVVNSRSRAFPCMVTGATSNHEAGR